MEFPEILAIAVMAAGLIFLSIEDVKHKTLPLYGIVIMGIALLAISIWQKNGWVFILTGLIPGGIAVFFSFLTKGGLGLGDAIMLLATGVYLGLWDGLSVLMAGLLLSSVFGIILIALKKAHLKSALPFVPFYLGGFAVWEVLKCIS